MFMRAIFVGRLLPKLAYEFVWVVCTTCRNLFFETSILSIFSPVLAFDKLTFIYMCAPESLCDSLIFC